MGDRDSRPIYFIVISLWLSRIHNKSTLYIVDSLRFQYPYCEFTINSLSLSWIYFEFFIISLCLSFSLLKNLLWLSRNDFWFFMKRLSLLWIHYISTMSMANSLWIHYLYRESTLYSLSVWRSDYESTLRCANSLLVNYLFYKLTSNALTASWIHKV